MPTVINSSRDGDVRPFEYAARVRFHQADPAGVLFFGRIFELVSDAYEDLILSTYLSFDEYFATRDYLVPIVRAEADYRRPIHVGESVTVRIEVMRVGRASLTYSYTVLGPVEDVRVQGQITHAFVDGATFQTIEIPARVKTALEPLVAKDSGTDSA